MTTRRSMLLGVPVLLVACTSSAAPPSTTARFDSPLPTAPPTTPPLTFRDSTLPPTTVAGGGRWSPPTEQCAEPTAVGAALDDTVRIGVIGPVGQGLDAAAAAGTLDGMRAYYDHAASQGLLQGYQVELRVFDDSGDPTLTPAVLTSALESGVDLFAGVIGTSSNLAVLDELNRRCIPHLFGITSAPQLRDVADSPWSTSVLPSAELEIAAYVADAERERSSDVTFGLVYTGNDFGNSYRTALVNALPSARLVAEAVVDPTQPVIDASQIEPIGSARPDAVVLAPDSVGCPTSLTSLAEWLVDGYAPLVYLVGPCATRFTATLSGNAMNGVRSAGFLRDVADLTTHSDPAIAPLADALPIDSRPLFVSNATIGWQVAALTVATLNDARSSGPLSRVGIMEAARRQSVPLAVAYPGIEFVLDGSVDAVGVEQVQVVAWDAASKKFSAVGPLFDGAR